MLYFESFEQTGLTCTINRGMLSGQWGFVMIYKMQRWIIFGNCQFWDFSTSLTILKSSVEFDQFECFFKTLTSVKFFGELRQMWQFMTILDNFEKFDCKICDNMWWLLSFTAVWKGNSCERLDIVEIHDNYCYIYWTQVYEHQKIICIFHNKYLFGALKGCKAFVLTSNCPRLLPSKLSLYKTSILATTQIEMW